MELMIPRGRLDRAVDHEKDHVFGPTSEIILVEYGSYACSHIMTWMWFQIFKTSTIPPFVSRRRGHQHAEVSSRAGGI